MEKLDLVTFDEVVVRIDQKATSERARSLRSGCGLSLREMAKRMGISAAYLSDIELGRRGWSEKLAEKFSEALTKKESQ